MRLYFRNVGWLAAAEMFSRLKGFVVIPLITAYLGALDYGVWAQVAVLIGIVPPLIVLGTDSALVRFLPGLDRGRQNAYFTAWALMLGALAVLAVSLIVLARDPIAAIFFGTSDEYARFVPLAGASIITTAAIMVIRSWFRINHDAKPISIVTIGQSILGLGAIVYVLVDHRGVYELVLFSFLGDALLAIAMAALIARRQGWARPDFSLLPQMIRFGLPLIPAGYAIWALNWLDRIFLVHYETLAEIGVYSLAYTLGYLIIQVAAGPIFFMFPNSAAEHWNRGERPSIQRLFNHSAGLIVLLVLPAIVGSAVLGEGLLHVLATPAFAGGAPVIPIVLAGYACNMLSAYYESMLGLVNRQYLSTVGAGLAFLVNLGLNFALIPRYGYVGAAIATSTAFMAQISYSFTMATRHNLLTTPVGPPLKALAASLAMGAVLMGLTRVIEPNQPLGLLALILCGTAVYVALCLLSGLVPRDRIRDEWRRLRARDGAASATA